MEHTKTSAIILSREPIFEYDGSIVAFTRAHGKMNLIAKGLYKQSAKLSAVLLSSNLVYLTLTKGTRWHITGAKTTLPFSNRLCEPRLLYLSSIVREILIELFPEEERSDAIFEKAQNCFTLLVSKKHSLRAKELIVYRFILAVFKEQGLLPDFSKCATDKKKIEKDKPRYWEENRGILCKVCVKKVDSEVIELPKSFTSIAEYTTQNKLSKKERIGISKMVQDIYSHEHHEKLIALTAWEESLV